MDSESAKPSGWRKIVRVMVEEVHAIHPRLIAMNLAASLLLGRDPPSRRSRIFSMAGFRVGNKTRFYGTPRLNGPDGLFSNLVVGEDCSVDVDCSFDLEEKITIGDRVTIGPGVMILTSTHELDIKEHRAGPVQRSPVVIGNGAWLGARSIILPGVTVGEGAIVNPGSVVNKDVAANTRVGGIPAAPLEVLGTNEVSSS
jgi:acetyltransferase-like isoleucine patch superfamily enzyme